MEPSEFRFSPIKKVRLSQRLTEYFIQEIECGSLPAGTRIPDEIALAKTLDVSRNALRESVKILESCGVLRTVNGKGTIVTEDAAANIRCIRFFDKLRCDTTALQLLDARRILEPEIAYYACERCTAEDLALLRKALTPQPAGDVPGSRASDYEFHTAIAAICGNELLTELLRTLLYRLREGRYAAFHARLEALLQGNSQREHEMIYQAFASREPAHAYHAMELHLSNRISIVRALYRPEADPDALEQSTVLSIMHPEDRIAP